MIMKMWHCIVWEIKECLNKCDFDTAMDMQFNGKTFKVPFGYDRLLRQKYGDYMQLPPENERIAHHFYSAYKK